MLPNWKMTYHRNHIVICPQEAQIFRMNDEWLQRMSLFILKASFSSSKVGDEKLFTPNSENTKGVTKLTRVQLKLSLV